MNNFFWFALKAVPLVGNVTFRRLVEHFSTPEEVFKASPEQLSAVKGMHPATISSIRTFDYRAAAERECSAVEQAGVQVVTFLSDHYPRTLLEIPDPPPYLYVRGHLDAYEPALAVVGSRRASTYGLSVAEKIARQLAERGVTVISGMARGIDTAAHRGAIKANGRSIGVLGCGIDILYPRENRELFIEMANKGALISEYPMGTEPKAENFPRRNRIISGLSHGVLVVEAAENSGSLITAQYALEQGREVFAIPGNITLGSSRGANRLIKQGAKLVEGIEDILDELPSGDSTSRNRMPAMRYTLSPEEAGIYTLLAEQPLHMDEIIVKSALTVGEVSAILLRLELNGMVTQLPGNHFTST